MAPIMLQGTGSEAGKTTLVAGLCRLFANRGLRVAPFKSQNMALNCFVTEEGEEIARATAVQAVGARQRPIVHMNPLLLKPKADDVSQLIVHGRAVRDVTAREYFLSGRLQEMKLAAIRDSIAYLSRHYDLIIAEGAGSCAEPNLREHDVANMGLADLLGAGVHIVADIDKGGSFASLLGSLRIMELTHPADVGRVRGFLLNKFRGDRTVLQPAIDFLQDQTGIPVTGVIPMLHGLALEEEDRLKERPCDHPEIDIAVLYLPHIANAGDVDPLAWESGVRVRFVRRPQDLGMPDAIIIPGTKNTPWDLDFLRRTGLEAAVLRAAASVPVIGICGGYQMLGRALLDPDQVESELGSIPGMGLLDLEVIFTRDKIVTNRQFTPTRDNPFAQAGPVRGYEIHCGRTRLGDCRPLYEHPAGSDGAVDPQGRVLGTFIHDLFHNAPFTRAVVNFLRARKNLEPIRGPFPDRTSLAEEAYELLAATLEANTSI